MAKRSLVGEVYHQIERLGDKEYAHIGFRDPDGKFGDMLAELVPRPGMSKKAKITLEILEEDN